MLLPIITSFAEVAKNLIRILVDFRFPIKHLNRIHCQHPDSIPEMSPCTVTNHPIVALEKLGQVEFHKLWHIQSPENGTAHII
jgi:hypothetical protein